MIGSKKWLSISREKLRKAPWNYKTDNQQKARKLLENIRRNGQVENVIVRKLNDGLFEVVNGNHRLDTFDELGIEKIVCYNMGTVSLAAAQRLAVETNETKFDKDGVKLAEVVASIVEEFSLEDLDMTMPFEEGELESLVKMADFDWDQFNKTPGDLNGGGSGGERNNGGEPLVCPECGHVFGEQ